MDRNVRKIESTPSKAQPDPPQPFSSYDDAANIVLLGDPGAGKTHTFRECAARTGGRYITARAFLVMPAVKFDGALFIDGLDEKRAGRSDRDTVDALVERLFATAPDKVRLSCRVADWLGESDLTALRPYFEQSEQPVVLQLDRLSVDEQRVVLDAEGLSRDEADAFLREATNRALGDFLENPQNLIMLLRAVRTGTWPETRRELFELSTQLMLKEFDRERARSGSGVCSVDELRPVAGAICAARLISDITAVSLADHEESRDIPSYRSLGMFPPEKVIAALGRRVFVAGPAPESVDYAHRTTAEYLGAAWLAGAVRSGMSFGRLQALMGVDGHPASELRGIHAWLAVHLSEYADRLIDTDPYGVLTYGDAASLPRSSCAHLVRALGRLSQTDPWFRSGNWKSPAIAALSRADMVDEFRAVLLSKDSGSGVRSIVVEAAALGTPMPALTDDLVDVVQRTQSPYAERIYALVALLRIEPGGEAAVEGAYYKLGAEVNDLRLRAEIIHRLYGKPFGPPEVAKLLTGISESGGSEDISGVLWSLPYHMPWADLPAVLDGLQLNPDELSAGGPHEREVARFIDRLLLRAWREIANIDPGRALNWLRLRNSYSRAHRGGRTDDLRTAVQEQPDRLRAMTDHFLETLVPDKEAWWRLMRFREVTFFQVPPNELCERMTAHMMRAPVGSQRKLFLYDAALAMTYSMEESEAHNTFEWLYDLADNREDLRELRDRSTSCKVPHGLLDRRSPANEVEHDAEAQRKIFEEDAEAIRSGLHLGWLSWAAQIYFSQFADVDEKAPPRERLNSVLGEANTKTAIEGFIAALGRSDLPSLDEVVALSAEHKLYKRWWVAAAGLIELWAATQDLTGFSDELLKAMLAFDLARPVFEYVDASSKVKVPDWKTAVLRDRPELEQIPMDFTHSLRA
jgi:hypothetical protein